MIIDEQVVPVFVFSGLSYGRSNMASKSQLVNRSGRFMGWYDDLVRESPSSKTWGSKVDFNNQNSDSNTGPSAQSHPMSSPSSI